MGTSAEPTSRAQGPTAKALLDPAGVSRGRSRPTGTPEGRRPEREEGMYLASSQDVRRQPKTPQGAFGREEARGTGQGPSAPSAQTETTSRGTGTETMLEQMLERHNMLAALKRVEANRGAPESTAWRPKTCPVHGLVQPAGDSFRRWCECLLDLMRSGCHNVRIA